jgi:hypothetical protein
MYRTHTYNIPLLVWAESQDRDLLGRQFQEAGLDHTLTLVALRRKRAWATTLPPGAFSGDLRAGSDTLAAEYARAFLAARGPRGYHSRRPFHATHDPVEARGLVFHHVEAIRALREHVARPALLSALYRFLLRAADDPTLIVPSPPQRPFIPHALRQRHFGLAEGVSCRGPAWTDAEDAVLRRWFGQRTAGDAAGGHAPLTPAQRDRVVAELGGRRTWPSIRQRLSDLNRQLLAEFAIDGLVPRARVAEYMSRAVGERPRLPPVGGRRARAPLSPEQRAALLARLGPISPWTEAEDALVREWFGIGAIEPIAVPEIRLAALVAQLPGRSPAAVRQRASKLRQRATTPSTPTPAAP